MEKTRHLTLSDEEKAAQKQKEAHTSLELFIRKYIHRTLTMDQFKKELNAWRQSFRLPDSVVLQEAVRQIDLDGDNQPVLTLLQTAFKADTTELQRVIHAYQLAVSKAHNVSSNQLKAQLASRHAISGTAVIADVENDKDWLSMRQQLQAEFRKQLDDRAERWMEAPGQT